MMRGLMYLAVYFGLCFTFIDKCEGAKHLEVTLEGKANLTWSMVHRLMKHLVVSVVNSRGSDFYKFALKAGLSEPCQGAAFKTLISLRNSDGWAVKMFDATGKLPSGVLEGTIMDFGSYDECLKIKTNISDRDDSEVLLGQYCLVGFKTHLLSPLDEKTKAGESYEEAYGNHPEWIDEVLRKGGKYLRKMGFWFGICTPSACNRVDIMKALKLLTKPYGLTTLVLDCNTDSPLDWTNYQTAAVCFLATIGVVVLLGTVLDVLLRFVSNKIASSLSTSFIVRVLRAFSVYSNTEIFLRCRKAAGNLDFFDGIRFFSATWIILGHTWFFTDTWKYMKFRRILGIPDTFNGQLPVAVIENFTIPVGSFFFMSGFLITYTSWNKIEESKGKLNILMFFVHKYWRMTPTQIATVALFFAMPLINSGPIWRSTLDPPTEACENTWWANLFYIQNWWNADDFCLLHTWYLATLMQLHLAGALILILTYRYPLVGTVTSLVIFMCCTVLTGLLASWHDFPMPAPGTVKDLDLMLQYSSLIYIKPYTHFSTYIIGMAFGYLVLKYQTVKLAPSFQVISWIFATLCGLAVVYGIYGPSEKMEIRAVYISLHRIGWALAIGWMTFCCASGNAGIVSRILSWKALAPLGQLSYLAYLLHPLVLWYRTASMRERMYYGHTELVYSFLGHTVVGFSLAYVCYVTIELPFSILENMLFSRFRASTYDVGPPEKGNDESNITTLSVKSSTEP